MAIIYADGELPIVMDRKIPNAPLASTNVVLIEIETLKYFFIVSVCSIYTFFVNFGTGLDTLMSS